jgi:hypothetical protein
MAVAGALADALMAMYSQLVDNVLGKQTVNKDGKPLRDVCYMHLPNGLPIEAKDFENAWTPDTAPSIASASGTTPAGGGAAGAGGVTPQGAQPTFSIDAARRTAELVDQRLKVTEDGSYQPYQGSELISSAYQAIIMKAQGIPAPPPPADIQKAINDAQNLLWVANTDGTPSGHRTPLYKQYEQLSQAWAEARKNYALANAAAQKDPALGAVWPETSSSLQTDVDNAWNDWRSADADKIENALDTLDSQGGSVGAFFVSQARENFKAWGLGLTGGVAVETQYAEVMPSTWYDPSDDDNGFAELTVSSSSWQGSSASSSSSQASNWYQGHSSSTGGGGGGMIFGITLGADMSHADWNYAQGSQGSGGTFNAWSASMSNVSIDFSWGLCNIYRPYLLSELFILDGWYLPQEPTNCISDGTIAGTIAGQKKDDAAPPGSQETHLLPMITTQFLVVRNVKITADNWGAAGDAMSSWCAQQQTSDQSSSNSASGGVGFLGLGGYVSKTSNDWSGGGSDSETSTRSWNYSGDAQHGTLSINGCQIVGWVGEILPASPRVDGTKQAAGDTHAATPAGQA